VGKIWNVCVIEQTNNILSLFVQKIQKISVPLALCYFDGPFFLCLVGRGEVFIVHFLFGLWFLLGLIILISICSSGVVGVLGASFVGVVLPLDEVVELDEDLVELDEDLVVVSTFAVVVATVFAVVVVSIVFEVESEVVVDITLAVVVAIILAVVVAIMFAVIVAKVLDDVVGIRVTGTVPGG